MPEETFSANQMPGRLIILNGTSSSGKSSVAKALQKKLAEDFCHVEMDAVWHMLAQQKSPPGQISPQSFLANYVDGFLERGENVILDIVFWETGSALYNKHNPFLVGIKPNLEVLEAREKARGDRDIGLARSQFEKAHQGVSYNLEIDNSSLTPEQTADKIIEAYAQAKLTPLPPEGKRNTNQLLPQNSRA